MLITCCKIIIKCKDKEKYIIPFMYITRKIEEKIGNLDVTPGIITIAKYYFFENKTIDPGLILELRVNW